MKRVEGLIKREQEYGLSKLKCWFLELCSDGFRVL